jgi:hypothetical protein
VRFKKNLNLLGVDERPRRIWITTATHSFETGGLYIEHADNAGRAEDVAMLQWW